MGLITTQLLNKGPSSSAVLVEKTQIKNSESLRQSKMSLYTDKSSLHYDETMRTDDGQKGNEILTDPKINLFGTQPLYPSQFHTSKNERKGPLAKDHQKNSNL